MINNTYRYLEISVLYLTDRYHGKGSWPPSPARLFQALVAAGRKGSSREEWQNSTALSLEWLERKDAPIILAPDVNRRGYHVTSVPRNQAEKAVRSNGIDSDYIRKHKDLKPFRPLLLSDDLEERFVYYLWSVSEEDLERQRNAIEKIRWIARRMSHLGLGIDQVAGNSRLVGGMKLLIKASDFMSPPICRARCVLKSLPRDILTILSICMKKSGTGFEKALSPPTFTRNGIAWCPIGKRVS